MRENNEKSQKETDIAFALATLMLNVLTIAVLCAGAWMLHSLITGPNSSGSFFWSYSL